MKKITLISIIATVFWGLSCKNNQDMNITVEKNVFSTRMGDNPDKEMRLGKKLENPYTIENMKKAYEDLKKKGITKNTDIHANYLYIRFLPENIEDYRLIHHNKEIELYDHPLDYEISTIGNKYKDPTTKDKPYTWYYCAIKSDFKIPNSVKHEILAELFLPLPNDKSLDLLSEDDKKFRKNLEKEALNITGNASTIKNGRVMAYNPSGRITMTDNVLGIIGIDGVKVRANRWFTTYTTLTDQNGNFFINDTFENPCNYSIKWERDDFDILEGGSLANFQAYYHGPKQSDPWIQNIDGGLSLMYAAIHRAAIRYYYRNNTLRTPRNGTFWSRLSIAAYDWENVGVNGEALTSGFVKSWLDFPDIRIYRPNRGSYAIYSTTIHELAHASHWAMDKWNFRNSDDVIIESWARCVQWHFTSIEYNQNWRSGIQFSDPNIQDGFNNIYTPIFIDLIDNNNQQCGTFWDEEFQINRQTPCNIVDNVNGYSIRQLEDILIGSRSMIQLRENARNVYENPSENNLNQLFSSYGIN